MKLLLDSHITKGVVSVLGKITQEIPVVHLADWQGGEFLHADDEVILSACYDERRTFVTFDVRTIPNLLRRWAAEERPHSGVFFGTRETLSPADPSKVAAAIFLLSKEYRETDVTNIVRFLPSVLK